MPVASCTILRMRPSPCGPCVIEVSVQWKTMRSGATSESSRAEAAISSAMSASGRFHGPATRARATCTPRPGGARRLNCGSVMLLTDGMIMPMRARAACGGALMGACSVAVASMMVPPGGFRAGLWAGLWAGLGREDMHRVAELKAIQVNAAFDYGALACLV